MILLAIVVDWWIETYFYRSTDYGNSWEQIYVIDHSSTPILYSFGINFSGDILLGSYQKVYRSMDHGDSWTETSVNTSITSFLTTNNVILAGGMDGGIYRSTDDGNNWSYITSLESRVYSLATNSNDNIFAGTWQGGIFLSTDEGINWVIRNNGLTDNRITSLSINPRGDIFASSYSGKIYRSTNNGDNWEVVFSYPTKIDDNNDNSVASQFSLSQNYPNPFNPVTKIKYTVPQANRIILKVYDVEGKEVKTLVDDKKTVGEYIVEFDG